MSYAGELSSHYAEIHERLMGKPKRQKPAPLPIKVTSSTLSTEKFEGPPPPQLNMHSLLGWVCEREGVGVRDVKSDSRYRPATRARMIFYHLAFRHKQFSSPRIGRFINRDHSSVLTGIQRINRYRATDEALDKRMREYEGAVDSLLRADRGENVRVCARCPFRR